MTFENVIIPFGRYEYVEGQRIKGVELEWNDIFAGFGLGYRTSLFPWYQDNVVEFSLTYEPRYRAIERARFKRDGSIRNEVDMLPAERRNRQWRSMGFPN